MMKLLKLLIVLTSLASTASLASDDRCKIYNSSAVGAEISYSTKVNLQSKLPKFVKAKLRFFLHEEEVSLYDSSDDIVTINYYLNEKVNVTKATFVSDLHWLLTKYSHCFVEHFNDPQFNRAFINVFVDLSLETKISKVIFDRKSNSILVEYNEGNIVGKYHYIEFTNNRFLHIAYNSSVNDYDDSNNISLELLRELILESESMPSAELIKRHGIAVEVQ